LNIQQSFFAEYPLPTIWAFLKDVKMVAECMPGATLREKISETEYQGAFEVRLGPIVANFEGVVDVKAHDQTHAGVIQARALDRRTGTRIQSEVRYDAASEGAGTRVRIAGEYSLAGSLAQFARKGLLDEVAGRLTSAFADALRKQIAAAQLADQSGSAERRTAAPDLAPNVRQIAGGALLLQAMLRWVRRLWDRGRRRGGEHHR
jgi:carbon-monoxide dehydrogenase small subunit